MTLPLVSEYELSSNGTNEQNAFRFNLVYFFKSLSICGDGWLLSREWWPKLCGTHSLEIAKFSPNKNLNIEDWIVAVGNAKNL